MNRSGANQLIIVLYAAATLLLFFTVGTFVYQYVAALSSLRTVISAFSNDRILSALWLSLLSAVVVAVISFILGVPLAYVLALKHFIGKGTLETLA